MTTIPLDAWDLALASVLVLLNGALSIALQLGLARQLLVAALRMVIQLVLVGFVLTTLFALVSPLWTGLTALAMVAFAGREVVARQTGGLPGLQAYGIGTGAMLMAVTLVMIFALMTQIQPEPWYHPRYALPLLGMLLGNTMTGVALGLRAFTQGAKDKRRAIEAQLALGATRLEALRPVTREALRQALTPIINAMAATGLVSLPGMMTGQILAGAEPMEAVKYQLLVLFLIAGGTALGSVTAVMALARAVTDQRHRLRLDRFKSGVS